MFVECPGYDDVAIELIGTESDFDAALGRGAGGNTRVWFRLTDHVKLTKPLDFYPLHACDPWAPILMIDSYWDPDTPPTQRPRFRLYKDPDNFQPAGGPLISWQSDRSGTDGATKADYTFSLRMDNVALDGSNLVGHLLSVTQSDYMYFRDVTFQNSGSEGFVIGPPVLDYQQPNAVRECLEVGNVSCVGSYQNSMMSFFDCTFDNIDQWALRLLNVIDFTIEGCSFTNIGSGSDGGAIRVQGPSLCGNCAVTDPNCSAYQNRKMFRGNGSIVDVTGAGKMWFVNAWIVQIENVQLGPIIQEACYHIG